MADNTQSETAYWTLQMEQAYTLMQEILLYPVVECGETLVDLAQAAERAGVKAAFSTRPTAAGDARIFRLRSSLVAPFVKACGEMNRRGWVMKVEDGYRTLKMQKALVVAPAVFDAILRTVLWETGGRTPETEFLTRRMSVLVAACPKFGTHMSASAIDISVLDAASGQPIDRGAPYLEMSAKTPMDSPFVSQQARENRRVITELMARCGFVAYPYEFWHYNAGDAYEGLLNRTGRPARYGPVNWDASSDTVKPIADPMRALNSPQEIAESIRQALRRMER